MLAATMRIAFLMPGLFLLLTHSIAQGSKLRVRSAGAGLQVNRMYLPLNHVFLIDYHLQNPREYLDYISQLGLYSDDGRSQRHDLKEFVFSAEFHKPGSASRFWKNYTVEAGVVVSGLVDRPIGKFDGFSAWGDTVVLQQYYQYRISRRQRFAGVILGLYRKWQLSRRLHTFIGVRVQPGFAFSNTFKSDWHSIYYRNYVPAGTSTVQARDWKGRHFYQGQASIPVGVEWSATNEVIVRMNLSAGILTTNLADHSNLSQYVYGAGLGILYSPQR